MGHVHNELHVISLSLPHYDLTHTHTHTVILTPSLIHTLIINNNNVYPYVVGPRLTVTVVKWLQAHECLMSETLLINNFEAMAFLMGSIIAWHSSSSSLTIGLTTIYQ